MKVAYTLELKELIIGALVYLYPNTTIYEPAFTCGFYA
jgi:hypothetical protein